MAYDRMAVYVVAHQDDWQLFMDPQISQDILDSQCRTLIIHVTAGDAGLERTYWRAREKAAEASLIFRRCAYDQESSRVGYKKLLGYFIRYWQLANCVCYYLRLPDGNMHGEGFARYKNQSLEQLRNHRIGSIQSVDGRNTYQSTNDISRAIDQLISKEIMRKKGRKEENITLHFPDFDPNINPADHNDHRNSAYLVQSSCWYQKVKKTAYVHYHIQHISPFLQGEELFWKVGMFSVYHQEMLRLKGHSTIGETNEYLQWAMRHYVCRQLS